MKRIAFLFLFICTAWINMFSQVDPCYVLTEVLREVDRAVVQGRYDDALRMLEKVKNEPKNRQCPEMKDGVVDYKIKDVKEKIDRRKKEQPSTSQSSMTASQMYELGFDYRKGRNGKTKDDAEAVKWFRKAADQGHSNGQAQLGFMYQYGYGVTKDYAEAVKWYYKSAEQGNASGQNQLGYMYLNGYGVTKDYTEAVKWFRKSAEQGDASGQNHLGYMYRNGYGVTKDYAEAVKWYRKAAEQGNASGQRNLGHMYENGYGVTKNLTEARKWYEKAAAQGNEYAKGRLKVLNGN